MALPTGSRGQPQPTAGQAHTWVSRRGQAGPQHAQAAAGTGGPGPNERQHRAEQSYPVAPGGCPGGSASLRAGTGSVPPARFPLAGSPRSGPGPSRAAAATCRQPGPVGGSSSSNRRRRRSPSGRLPLPSRLERQPLTPTRGCLSLPLLPPTAAAGCPSVAGPSTGACGSTFCSETLPAAPCAAFGDGTPPSICNTPCLGPFIAWRDTHTAARRTVIRRLWLEEAMKII